MISVAMPTFETFGRGCEFLSFQFEIFKKQTFQNFELIISDHSKDTKIKELCEKYSKDLNIKYYKNELQRGSLSHNTNNAIRKCTGNIIKILFQDDFLAENNSLQIINDSFSGDAHWIIGSCEHVKDKNLTRFNKIIPKYNDEIFLGNNTIGNPSVVAFKNTDDKIFLDEKLTWMVDVDFYKKMFDKYGPPKTVEETVVIVRHWKRQLTHIIPNRIKNKEARIMMERYAKTS